MVFIHLGHVLLLILLLLRLGIFLGFYLLLYRVELLPVIIVLLAHHIYFLRMFLFNNLHVGNLALQLRLSGGFLCHLTLQRLLFVSLGLFGCIFILFVFQEVTYGII